MKNHNAQTAWRISVAYALIGSFWLFISDQLLGILVPNPQQVTRMATYQSVLFMAVTTVLIYFLVLRELWLRPAQSFVNQAAVAPELLLAMLPAHGQSYIEIQKRLVESNSLQRLTAALLQQQTLDDILPLVCRQAQQLTGAGGARLLLLENEAWLRVFHQTGQVMPNLERIPIGHGLAELALQKEVLLTNDPANYPQLFQPHPDLKSLLAIPLLLKNEVIGTLHVVNKPGGFTQGDTHMLCLFADQAAMAITNARLHEQAKQSAVEKERQRLARELHDSVTQVLYSVILYADATRLAFAADKKNRGLRESARTTHVGASGHGRYAPAALSLASANAG